MTAQVVAQLDESDLTRWQQMIAQREAASRRPAAYSRSELERMELEFIRFLSEVAARYDMDDARLWSVSQYTGVIFYGEIE